MGVAQCLSRYPFLGKLRAPCMAQAAGFDLQAYRRGAATAMRIAGRIALPSDTIPFVQEDCKPLEGILILPEWKPVPLAASPMDMPRAPTMACFATDADFGPCRVETVVDGVIVLLHAGRMAFGAHEVPVLVELGPVQHIVVLDLLIGIEMKPALAALILRPAIPGN